MSFPSQSTEPVIGKTASVFAVRHILNDNKHSNARSLKGPHNPSNSFLQLRNHTAFRSLLFGNSYSRSFKVKPKIAGPDASRKCGLSAMLNFFFNSDRSVRMDIKTLFADGNNMRFHPAEIAICLTLRLGINKGALWFSGNQLLCTNSFQAFCPIKHQIPISF